MTQITLTSAQHVALLALKDYILPQADCNPDVVKDLIATRMIRVLPDDKLAISGQGIAYLLTHPHPPASHDTARVTPPAAAPVQPDKPTVLEPLSDKALARLQEIALSSTPVTRKDIGPCVYGILVAAFMIQSSNGRLLATEAGLQRLAAEHMLPPSPERSPSPLPPEIPSSAADTQEIVPVSPPVALEITVEAGTLPEAVETLHEIANAVGEGYMAAVLASAELPVEVPDLPAQVEALAESRSDSASEHVSIPDLTAQAVAELHADLRAHDDTSMIDPPSVNHPDQYDEDDCDAAAYGELDDSPAACDHCLTRRFVDYLRAHSGHIRALYDSYEQRELAIQALNAAQDDLDDLAAPLRDLPRDHEAGYNLVNVPGVRE